MADAATTTGPKLARLAFNMAGGPTNAEESATATQPNITYVPSSITFLSSQLVAHGFVRPPGLVEPLTRLGTDDQELVVKCLRNLLEQRVTDMERLDELSSKLRTSSLDHERLLGLQKVTKDQVFHAQKETEIAKSKHATTTAQLNDLQATHKQVNTNLQRAQSALVFARQTAQNEIKRKDKEIERIQERWAKVANEQSKNGSSAQLRCTNLIATTYTGDTPVPKGDGILESSLARLRADHDRISLQNESFRVMLVTFATGLDRLVRRANPSYAKANGKELSEQAVFPPCAQPWKEDAENARVALQNLMVAAEFGMQDRMFDVLEDGGEATRAREEEARREKEHKEALLQEVETLKFELEESRNALTDHMNGALEAYAHEQRILRNVGRPSIGDRHAELQERETFLEEERERLATTAIELGKERNALAAAKLELQEEKRAWKLQQLLEDIPGTPAASLKLVIPAPMFVEPADSHQANRSRKSRSPKKGTSSSVGTMRLSPTKKSPRKLLAQASGSGLLKPPSFDDVYEEDEEEDLGTAPRLLGSRGSTESLGPIAFDLTSGRREEEGGNPLLGIGHTRMSDGFMAIGDAPSPSSAIRATTSTVNPFDQILAESAQAAESLSKLNLSPERAKPSGSVFAAPAPAQVPSEPQGALSSSSVASSDGDEEMMRPSESSSGDSDNNPSSSGPKTPISLSAATARLKKNPYAPVVPSPLSRILRMADSPPSPQSKHEPQTGVTQQDTNVAKASVAAVAKAPLEPSRWTLGQLDEGDEEEDESGGSGSEGTAVAVPLLTLADELGMDAGELETFPGRSRSSPDKRPVGRRRAVSPRRNKETSKGRLLGNHPRIAPSSTLASGMLRGSSSRMEKENAFPPIVTSQSLASRAIGIASASTMESSAGSSTSKKITVGHRVVGGRPTINPPFLRAGSAQARLLNNASGKATGPVRGSLRAHMQARFGGTTVPIGD